MNASRKTHAGWTPPSDRRDPVEILEETNQGRVESLIPIRYGRMLGGPFPFLRGSAALMAEDLASTPTSGIRVQSCGDCHLLNFGLFASPERNLFFGINDFDETLEAPFEWDVKRLAVSFMVASQANAYSGKDASGVVETVVRSYRESMAELADDAGARRLVHAHGRGHDPRDGRDKAAAPKPRGDDREGPETGGRVRLPEAHVRGERPPPVHGHAAPDLPREPEQGGDRECHQPLRPVPRLPPRRPQGDPGPLPPGRHRVEGRGDRLGRHPVLRPAPPGRGRGPADPAGQGGAALRARAVRRDGAVRAAGPARGRGAAADADRERHLPRLVSRTIRASISMSASSGI